MMARPVRGYVTVDKRQMHYRSLAPAGAGPDDRPEAVLLHQVSSSSRMFESFMPILAAAGIGSVAPDLPGFGESDPLPSTTVDGWAQSVLGFSDEVGAAGRVWLMGHHTGAGIAVEVALTAPERVAGLVLVGVPFHVSAEARQRRWEEKRIVQILPNPDGSHLVHEWERIGELAATLDLDLWHREVVDTLKSDRYDLAYEAIFGWDSPSRLPLLRVPVLLIAGTRDTLFPGQIPASRAIPGVQLEIVEDGGVFMFDERTDELANLVIAFIERARRPEAIASTTG